jgi:galactokinase
VPGRLEVLGKHTDYAGGRSLVCAVDRGFLVAAGPRVDRSIVAVDAHDGETVTVPPDTVATGPVGWRGYVETVARRLSRNFGPALGGATIVFSSDLPRAAGLSSSSALVVSCTVGLAVVNRLAEDARFRAHIGSAEDLATYVSCIENGQDFGALAGDAGVGTRGGSEDHVAMLCGVPGHLSAYAYCPTRLEGHVPLPEAWRFVIAVSGVTAEKTAGAREAYNRASRDAARLLEIWNRATGRRDASLAAALASADSAPARLVDMVHEAADGAFAGAEAGDRLAARLGARLEHFIEESTRLVPAVTGLLAAGQIEAIGPLVDRSQAAAERLLGNQVPETIALARDARELGAVAASAFGAGFGGSVWALVRTADAATFAARWSEHHLARFPARAAQAATFVTRPGPAAMRFRATADD